MILTTTVRVPDTPEVRAALTLQQKELSALSAPGTLIAFSTEEAGWLEVPKMWGLQRYEVDDRQGPHIAVTTAPLSVTLRPHQAAALTAIESAFAAEHGGGGVLVLPCGFGKTMTAIALAQRMGVRCLIVCHTGVLMEQWRAAIAQFVPDAVIGEMQQNKFVVDGCTHVIASLKSVALRDYPPHGCGLLCIDEAHHISALLLSKAVAKLGTRWRLGLSATPTRADGLSPFMTWSLGPTLFEQEREAKTGLRVFAVRVTTGPVKTKTLRRAGKEVANISGMMNLLVKKSVAATRRQELVAAWIRLCASKGRKVLVLADRLELLRDLSKQMGEFSFGFMTGAVKVKDRAAAAEAQILLGTYGVVAEGFDEPRLDTVVLTTPRSGQSVMTQVVGRLLRDGGKSPLVIDFVDDVPLFVGMHWKRMKVYRKLQASVTCYDEQRNEV
ncbi:P-loop containing nucleoside triphosphate hydrolase protein [Tribonema minus]|uniref:P-loop containing nucleoside triphosphate hydrolase protein n=1 Tax=Tribonema minus TaxID=303371 RepID=A0A835YY40_9STRA|nr:P-loop containing nucleoside triphosphate hydrolase protein [Tribonema minus]